MNEEKLLVKYNKAHNFQKNLLDKNKSIVEKLILDEYSQSIHINTHIDDSLPEPKGTKSVNKEKTIQNISKTDPLVNKLIHELGLELT